jgi:pyrrolidone-carboxylate peptidase
MKILVTGFDPFEGEPINPSWEAVCRLPDTVEAAEIIKVQIPTCFGRSADVVRAAILERDPDVVVSVGQAGGQFAISPERVAINVDDGGSPTTTVTSRSTHRFDLTGQRPTSPCCPSRRWSLPSRKREYQP